MEQGVTRGSNKQAWLRMVLVSLAITLSEPIYVIVCYVLKITQGGDDFTGLMGPEVQEFALSYRWHVLGIAVVLVAVPYVFRRVLINTMASVAGKLMGPDGSEDRIFKNYFMTILMSMALCESAGILGLLYFLATGDFTHAAILFALVFAAKYGHWPRRKEYKRLLPKGE